MSMSNCAVAHELFYMRHSTKTERSGSNFHIRRGLDYTVAYSFSTPIAVYPDKGGFVLMDAYCFSATTSKHQCYLKQAVPANVRCITFEWLGCNSEWQYCSLTPFKEVLATFIKRIERKLTALVTDKDDYAYAKDRQLILETMQRLQHAFEFFGRKRILKVIEKKVSFINNPERIKKAQQKHAAERAEAKRKREKAAHEQRVSSTLRKFLQQHEGITRSMQQRLSMFADTYPVFCLRQFRNYCLQAGYQTTAENIAKAVINKLETELDTLWKLRHNGFPLRNACDLKYMESKPGHYVTTQSVVISHSELQRCLRLRRLGRLMGNKVEDRYPVLHNNDDELTIGCHHFPQEVVQRIDERYFGKEPEQVAEEEKQRILDYRIAVGLLLAGCICQVQEALRQDETAAALLGNELAPAA